MLTITDLTSDEMSAMADRARSVFGNDIAEPFIDDPAHLPHPTFGLILHTPDHITAKLVALGELPARPTRHLGPQRVTVLPHKGTRRTPRPDPLPATKVSTWNE